MSVTSISKNSGISEGLHFTETEFNIWTKIPPSFTPCESPTLLTATSSVIFSSSFTFWKSICIISSVTGWYWISLTSTNWFLSSTLISKIICPVLSALFKLILSIDKEIPSAPEWYTTPGTLFCNLVLLAADVPWPVLISTFNFSNLLMLLS